jgi:hypothetical protein
MPAKIAPFVLVVVDRDKGVFTVEGPMTDDTSWNAAVVKAQDAGRDINCHVPGGVSRSSLAAAKASYAAEFPYKYVPPSSIIPRPATI